MSVHVTAGAHGVSLPGCGGFCAGRHALISTHDVLPVPAVPGGHGPHCGPASESVHVTSELQPPWLAEQPGGMRVHPAWPVPR